MQKKQFKKKYLWYAVAAIVIIAAVVFYNSKKYPFINNKIGDLVENKTDDLYKIAYDSISVNEVGGDLYIHNLSIKGDTALQKRYMQDNNPDAQGMLLDIFVPVLKVVGFKTAKALLSKEMTCNRIIISDPRVTVYVFPGQAKDTDIKRQGLDLYQQILGKFNLIQADSVSVINSEVVTMDFKSKETKFHTYNTTINLIDLRIDSTHNYDTTRTLFCKEISLHTAKVTIGEKDATSEASNLTFDTRNEILAISKIEHKGKSGEPFRGSAEGIAITGIEATGAVETLNLVVNKAFFKKATVQLNSKQEKDVKEKTDNRMLKGWVKSFKMNELQAGDISVTLGSGQKQKKDLTIDHSAIKIKNLFIDTTSVMDKSLVKNASEIDVSNPLISIKSADGLYMFKFAGVKVNTLSKTIGLKELSVNPLVNETLFAKKAKVQKDRYNISFKNLLCSTVNFDALMDGSIDIGTVKTSNSSLKIYRDVTYPLDSVKKVGNHPHQAIMKMKMPVNVRQFIATNTLIEYKEKNPKSDTSGAVRFEKSTVNLTNITNAAKPSNSKMDLVFETLFLGQIPLKTNIKFDLDNIDQGNYQVTGSINKPFSGALLNPVIIPMGLVRVDKGTINGMNFSFTGNNTTAQGLFSLKYDNLKLSLMKRDKNNNKFNKKGIISLLANVVVKNSNPTNNKLRQADIVYRRDDYKSFFNMVWKFMFNGIKDVMGAKL